MRAWIHSANVLFGHDKTELRFLKNDYSTCVACTDKGRRDIAASWRQCQCTCEKRFEKCKVAKFDARQWLGVRSLLVASLWAWSCDWNLNIFAVVFDTFQCCDSWDRLEVGIDRPWALSMSYLCCYSDSAFFVLLDLRFLHELFKLYSHRFKTNLMFVLTAA